MCVPKTKTKACWHPWRPLPCNPAHRWLAPCTPYSWGMLCKCPTRDACRLHAGCMQPACSLHAACCILYAACCNLQPPAYDRMQAACRLHAACMQPAASCMQPAATCNLLHTIVFTKNATIGTTFRRPRRAGRRRWRAGRRRLHAGVDALQISLKSMM